jgi:iron(III) transport system ATP-binding protein
MTEDETAAGPLLELQGLTRRFPGAETPAVREVSLAVGRGEILAVVGQSGSGKTTLLRLVAGLEIPDRGTVRIAGTEVAGPGRWVPPEERPLGMLFQEGALFPHLSVAENVEFGLRRRPRSERGERRTQVLRLVGLEGYGDRYPHQLSGGERRRVALARALAPEPELVLLDEPFTGLDENLTARLRSAVSRILRETGTTALLVLHHTDQVLPVADRIAVMEAGRVLQVGTPTEVYGRPRTEYVGRLFGPVNVLPARPRDGRWTTPLGSVPSRGADDVPAEARPGGPCRLCLRPEELELAPPGGGRATGHVVEVGYRGDRLEVSVRLPDTSDGELTVQVRVEPGDAPRRGDRVGVGIRPGCGHLLERE